MSIWNGQVTHSHLFYLVCGELAKEKAVTQTHSDAHMHEMQEPTLVFVFVRVQLSPAGQLNVFCVFTLDHSLA